MGSDEPSGQHRRCSLSAHMWRRTILSASHVIDGRPDCLLTRNGDSGPLGYAGQRVGIDVLQAIGEDSVVLGVE